MLDYLNISGIIQIMKTEEKKQQGLIKDTKKTTLSDWLVLNQWCSEQKINQKNSEDQKHE
jgi:hypothetical protein